jgi:8-oxo-dGTP diphosphatase
MKERSIRTIRIAAALIDDHSGRLLLVRKAGTQWFMQAGGKIEDGESALSALRRELHEEIGLAFAADLARHLGTFWASAANEPNHIVEAEVFHIRVSHDPVTRSEIKEAVWVSAAEAARMPLAPLTREHILPLSLTLSSPA